MSGFKCERWRKESLGAYIRTDSDGRFRFVPVKSNLSSEPRHGVHLDITSPALPGSGLGRHQLLFKHIAPSSVPCALIPSEAMDEMLVRGADTVSLLFEVTGDPGRRTDVAYVSLYVVGESSLAVPANLRRLVQMYPRQLDQSYVEFIPFSGDDTVAMTAKVRDVFAVGNALRWSLAVMETACDGRWFRAKRNLPGIVSLKSDSREAEVGES